jgi:hypothetical protein
MHYLNRRALAFAVMTVSVACVPQVWAADDVWANAYDASTQTRYVPLELILGAPWSGRKEITMPQGRFTENVSRDPSTWRGPQEWQHPDLGKKLMVYDRSRRGVGQRFAVRDDGSAIGRVSDTRFGISSCDQEAKYPLGYWKQGETRQFEYRCWYGREGERRVDQMLTTISIEQLDFEYQGNPHSLQIRWILRTQNDPREVDNRVYVFSPDKGVVLVGR